MGLCFSFWRFGLAQKRTPQKATSRCLVAVVVVVLVAFASQQGEEEEEEGEEGEEGEGEITNIRWLKKQTLTFRRWWLVG